MIAVYVTGTDTGIGKTLASCVLLHALRGQGRRAVGMKPVASGCKWLDGEWKNDDALFTLFVLPAFYMYLARDHAHDREIAAAVESMPPSEPQHG